MHRFDQLQQEYNDLWELKYPEILNRLTDPIGDAQTLASIQDLERKVDALKKTKERQAELFKAMQLKQKATNDDLLALRTRDDDRKKDDDDKEDKDRDVAERFQEQLKDLLGKLGKELSPVTEEVRKALERAVGEIHQSLEKEGLSAESLGKALEKSQEDLRKAFEGGGAVDKELREAIERARKDMQDAFDRSKGDVQDQVETLRQQSRELTDQARENFERARSEAEKRIGRDGEGQPNRDELESARKEIRDLQQQLRAATRRLEELSAAAVAPKPRGTPRAKPAAGRPSSRTAEHTACGTCAPSGTGKAGRTRDTGPAGATYARRAFRQTDPAQASVDAGRKSKATSGSTSSRTR